ncbi:hypothetical protein FF38_02177 [Lucilia cuprina]|uniref:Uncharacterized protein n=1 Tax=Lucilia cuprina TaxID=7375 RepID=A0A0L0BY34_LUCCU|nr:hypothetical protein FF38_02177 [Lucilia cuprina]
MFDVITERSDERIRSRLKFVEAAVVEVGVVLLLVETALRMEARAVDLIRSSEGFLRVKLGEDIYKSMLFTWAAGFGDCPLSFLAAVMDVLDVAFSGKPKFLGNGYVAKSVPSRLCREESNMLRFLVVIFSQIPTCFLNVTGLKVREHMGQGTSSRLASGSSVGVVMLLPLSGIESQVLEEFNFF